MTDYLTVIEVLAIHDDQIARYGGSPSVQDLGLLEAALFRPQTGYYADLIEEAAALWESLSQNHPFVDGNKRTAFAVTYTFLAINGLMLTADADQIFAFISGLHQAGTFRFLPLVRWLRLNVASEQQPGPSGAPEP
jgi:death-on-curing protein